MEYLCNPLIKYVVFLISFYIMLKYVIKPTISVNNMKISLAENNIRGISLIATIIIIILDFITIKNHHKSIINISNNVNTVKNEKNTEDDEFIVEDIQSLGNF